MTKPAKTQPCPCGGSNYIQCCKPYIEDGVAAPTAPLLMRSRYTAFVLRDNAYLTQTWHPDTLPDDPILSEEDVKWIGLDIKQDKTADDTHASVEFVARFKVGGRAHRLHEISQFERIKTNRYASEWVYVDGTFPEDSTKG